MKVVTCDRILGGEGVHNFSENEFNENKTGLNICHASLFSVFVVAPLCQRVDSAWGETVSNDKQEHNITCF